MSLVPFTHIHMSGVKIIRIRWKDVTAVSTSSTLQQQQPPPPASPAAVKSNDTAHAPTDVIREGGQVQVGAEVNASSEETRELPAPNRAPREDVGQVQAIDLDVHGDGACTAGNDDLDASGEFEPDDLIFAD